MRDFYVLKPEEVEPPELNNPLIDVKRVYVKCPLCEYTLKLIYTVEQEHLEPNDREFYTKDLEYQHKRFGSHESQ